VFIEQFGQMPLRNITVIRQFLKRKMTTVILFNKVKSTADNVAVGVICFLYTTIDSIRVGGGIFNSFVIDWILR
jgi:hypothetical protein